MHQEVHDEERPGLQRLLRGAKESAASLPAWSPRLKSVEGLAEDLARLLDVPQQSLDRESRSGPTARP